MGVSMMGVEQDTSMAKEFDNPWPSKLPHPKRVVILTAEYKEPINRLLREGGSSRSLECFQPVS